MDEPSLRSSFDADASLGNTTMTTTNPDDSPANSKDDLGVVDISMWTHENLTSSVSPDASRVIPWAEAPTSCRRQRDDNDKENRSNSPDSENDDIPFAIGRRSNASSPTGTIVLQPSYTDPSVDRGRSIGTQAIQFIEGSPLLHCLPLHLYNQLESYCQMHETDYPDIIKSKWPVSTVYHTTRGYRTWFESPQVGDQLVATRYRYGKQGQFIVVQDEARQQFNGGKAAIITHDDSTAVKRQVNGLSCTLHKWHVWDPFGKLPQPIWCWKVMELPPTATTSAASLEARPPPAQGKSVPTMVGELARSSTVQRIQPPRSKEVQQSVPGSTAMRSLRRPSAAIESTPPAKRARLSLNNLDSVLSKIDNPGVVVGARRDSVTGEMLMRRKSDGKVVMLRCPECEQDGCQSQQGLYNHLRTAHNTRLPGRESVADHCGIPINETALMRGVITALETPKRKGRSTASSLRAQPLPQTTQARTTSLENVNTADLGRSEAQFVFMKSPDDKSPRKRPLSSVSTADKLFVNALVAGVARKDTLMLTVTIANSPPFHIVRYDKEDFSLIEECIRTSRHKNPDVIITVEDLDV